MQYAIALSVVILLQLILIIIFFTKGVCCYDSLSDCLLVRPKTIVFGRT